MSRIPWSYRFYRLTWNGLDLLFPPVVCGGCGRVGWRWCPECQERVPRLHGPICERCGIPTNGPDTREKCRSNPPAYRKMRSWAVFDSPVQDGLHTMKYRRNIGLGEALALQMADFVRSLQWPIQMLIPVPLSKKRRKERGYNQVGLVARPLAYQIDLMYEPGALQKVRETRTQVGLTISQRAKMSRMRIRPTRKS